MSVLPEGWICETLSELTTKIVDGSHNPPPSVDVGEPMLSARNIEGGRINFDNYRLITSEAFEREDARTAVSPGDVLLTIVGTIGRSAVVPREHPRFALQRSVAVLRPNASVLPHYLRYYLQADETQQWMLERAKGTAQKGIYLGELAKLPCLIPPLAEQGRIVAKLHALTARTARARADLDRVPSLAVRYKQEVLEKAFAGELFADGRGSWKSLTLGELGKWGSGGTPKSGRVEYYGGAIPWVRSGDLSDGPIVSHAVTITDAGLANSSAKLVPKEAVLLAMYGATIGRVGLTTYPVTTNQAVASLQCDQSIILPSFAFWLLRSLKPAFVGAGQGGAQPNISQTIIKSWPAIVPPLDKQDQIVRGLERAFSDIDRLTDEATAARRLLDRLDRAILAKAFRGELVLQDPADEPASILIDRIQAERAGSPKAKRKRSSQPPAVRKRSDMPKSRLDDDVKHQPFLASILKASGVSLSADSLFKSADLPIADFYKQLAWEIDNGLVAERGGTLEAA